MTSFYWRSWRTTKGNREIDCTKELHDWIVLADLPNLSIPPPGDRDEQTMREAWTNRQAMYSGRWEWPYWCAQCGAVTWRGEIRLPAASL